MIKLQRHGAITNTPLEVWNVNPLHPEYAQYMHEQVSKTSSRQPSVDLSINSPKKTA